MKAASVRTSIFGEPEPWLWPIRGLGWDWRSATSRMRCVHSISAARFQFFSLCVCFEFFLVFHCYFFLWKKKKMSKMGWGWFVDICVSPSFCCEFFSGQLVPWLGQGWIIDTINVCKQMRWSLALFTHINTFFWRLRFLSCNVLFKICTIFLLTCIDKIFIFKHT